MFLVCIPYIIWDHLVAGIWWSFNPKYILGIHLGNLPIEEILFFVAVPWSSLVVWERLKRFSNEKVGFNLELFILVCSVLSMVWGFIKNTWYTFTISLVVASVVLMSFFMNGWLSKKS